MAMFSTELIRLPSNATQWGIFVIFISGGSLMAALGLQEVLNQEPCALCLTQRIALCLVGITAVWSMYDNPSRRCYHVFMLIFTGLGLLLIFRQFWIMWVPGADQSCGPGLSYLIENEFPASTLVRAMIVGTTDCGAHPFTPLASLLAFLLVGFGTIKQWLSPR